ncbi:MAG: hypothetical protein IKO05_10725 [Selenomonadaceae bacterium]|nr:hypothetical protein [Selenomonadaceae bacterium]
MRLTDRQAQANVKYKDRVYQKYLDNGLSEAKARERSEAAALKYAGKQHRYRAESIVLTENAFAYNRGAHMSVSQLIADGYMGRCEMVWTTAGTNRVCGRCMELKDTVVGYTDQSGVTIPPLHPRCRCAIMYREVGTPRVMQPKPQPADIVVEMPRRRRAQDGHEIIDKPTYNKLTKSFLKAGGLIIRGEDAAQHLKLVNASASYLAGENVAFIADDATISDVLEEMYHARQDRAKMFGEITEDLVWLKREINAQHYLLRAAKKYKIPPAENAVTKKNLERYEKQLEEILNERRVHDCR